MGPTSKVLLESDDESTLDTIDSVLAAVAKHMVRTRKGRVWDVRVEGRPVHVWIEDSVLYLGSRVQRPQGLCHPPAALYDVGLDTRRCGVRSGQMTESSIRCGLPLQKKLCRTEP